MLQKAFKAVAAARQEPVPFQSLRKFPSYAPAQDSGTYSPEKRMLMIVDIEIGKCSSATYLVPQFLPLLMFPKGPRFVQRLETATVRY